MTEGQIQFKLDSGKQSYDEMYRRLSEPLKPILEGFLATLKPSSAEIYKGIIVKFLSGISSIHVLKQYNLNAWNEYAQANITDGNQNTAAKKVSAIRSFFNYLIKIGERKTNPLDGYEIPKRKTGNPKRIILNWEQIAALKQITDEKQKEIFEAAYYYNKPIADTGYNNSYISYQVGKMGEKINVSGLKYSDITAAHKNYHAICPVTGKELEMTEDNWMFKDGLLQARNNNKE